MVNESSPTAISKKALAIERVFVHKGQKFAPFSSLPNNETAFKTVTHRQKLWIWGLGAAFLVVLLLNWRLAIFGLIVVLTLVYFADVLFNLLLVYKSFTKHPEIKFTEEDLKSLSGRELPVYTIFCPLYREWKMLPQFIGAIGKLDYPKEKLQVMLLLEQDDEETISHAKAMGLPYFFEIVIVPQFLPKTKPKALNYGMRHARGKYSTIYDAEDMPDPQQLKKAVLAFERLGPKAACIQSKLNFYNPSQNILTRLFTAEYSLWFDLVLPGLQSLNAPIPLGGTSNHFRMSNLRELEGWDAFNVTEDCELGMRLVKNGYYTAIMDSTTYEEANSNYFSWFRQRSRWIKGYMQTYLVHMRSPQDFKRKLKEPHLFLFQFIVGGKILSMFVNPMLWIITIIYFTFRIYAAPIIEPFFPSWILYLGVFALVFGNFLYLYYYMVGLAKRQYYGLIKYAFLVPVYWLSMSVATWRALYEIIYKPHYWAKTAHGLHLDKEILDAEQEIAQIKTPKMAGRLAGFFSSALGSGSLLVLATTGANFLNFLFNALLGRFLSLEDFATVTLFGTVLNILAVILSALGGAVTYKTAYLLGQNKRAATNIFVKVLKNYVWWSTAVMSAVWLILTPVLASFFHINNLLLIFSFTPVLALGSIAAVQNGFLRGRFRFGLLGQAILYEALSKLIIAIVLVYAGLHAWASLAIPLSIVISFIATGLFANFVRRSDKKEFGSAQDEKYQEKFPAWYFGVAIMSGLSSAAFLNMDVLLAKHYLSPQLAGAYSLLSLVGKIVFFMGTLLAPFVTTLVSRHEGAGTNSQKDFNNLLFGTAAVSTISFLAAGIFGKFFIPLLFGSRSLVILPYLFAYCLAMSLFAVATTIVSYHVVKKRYSFSVLLFVSSAFLIIGIVRSHSSIGNFSGVMLMSALVSFGLIIAWHAIFENFEFIRNKAINFLGMDVPKEPISVKAGNQRILIFNWRDTKHAYAGGAEVYVNEMAKRWVLEGNHITLFCGNDRKNLRAEVVDGMHVVRRGGFYFVYFWAFVYYMLQFRGKYDVILDCHNGIPFFTPLFTKEKVYCLMHHVHQEVFHRHLPEPLASFAAFLENTIMPLVYRRTKFITISNSSKTEMAELGLGRAGMSIVHPGVDLKNLEPGTKYHEPLIVYLGRLKAYKSVDVLIRAFKVIAAKLPHAKLVIAGDGEDRGNLERLAHELGLEDKVDFPGKISERQKITLLKRAWVFCNPSMMEGWGITTIEANACGVPVVAADVPGLRDSVQNPHTGYLVEHGNAAAFAEKILKILVDEKLQNFMSINSLQWASNFNWNKSASQALKILYE